MGHRWAIETGSGLVARILCSGLAAGCCCLLVAGSRVESRPSGDVPERPQGGAFGVMGVLCAGRFGGVLDGTKRGGLEFDICEEDTSRNLTPAPRFGMIRDPPGVLPPATRPTRPTPRPTCELVRAGERTERKSGQKPSKMVENVQKHLQNASKRFKTLQKS